VESNDNSIQFRNGFDPCVHRVQLLSKCIVQLVNEFGILAMDNEFQTPQILAAILKKAQALRVSSASGEIDAYMGQLMHIWGNFRCVNRYDTVQECLQKVDLLLHDIH
jgi:hypothetical protein